MRTLHCKVLHSGRVLPYSQILDLYVDEIRGSSNTVYCNSMFNLHKNSFIRFAPGESLRKGRDRTFKRHLIFLLLSFTHLQLVKSGSGS